MPAGATLFFSLLAVGFSPLESRADSQRFDADAYRWAAGRTIDTVYVHGNTRVKAIAVVREMESAAGGRLDPRVVDRDQRYIGDLSPFATVAIHVEPIGEDRCVLHVVVTERPTLLLNLVYPVLDYDINSERFVYGLKWHDRNFRRRLEDLNLEVLRDNRENDNASVGWSTGWLGWRHIGLGARVSYFNRHEFSDEPTVVQQTRGQVSASVPLTESRIKFSQLIFGLALADNEIGFDQGSTRDELLLSPSIGFRYDDRDGTVKPRHGVYFYTNILSNRVFDEPGTNYYRLDNDVRLFHALDAYTVLAARSALSVQLGEYPEYIRFGIGGPGTIRGYERSDFRSAHRWVQSLELRILPWAKQLYRLPILGTTDFQFGLVAFVDTGIGWTEKSEFSYENFHSGFGVGVRLFSPIQDVVRVDVGYTRDGTIRPYFSTGLNF
jgi:outer membrane protein assembly factor BamA